MPRTDNEGTVRPEPIGMTSEAEDDESEIDLLEIGSVLLDKLHYIIFFFLLGAVILNAFSYFAIHPTYSSTSSIYIVTASGGNVVDLTDLNIGTNLKNDYKELIMSYPVLDRVSEKLGLDYNTSQMQKLITIENPADTRILKLVCTAQTPELARDIANTLADVAVEYLPDTMKTDAPTIAQRARLPEGIAAPSYKKYTLIGGLIGALLAIVYFIIRHLMDDTIRTAEDMEKYFGVAPLTTIPYTKELDSLSSGLKGDAHGQDPKKAYRSSRKQRKRK